MSINWGVDKKDVIYPYNRVFVHKKEWNTDTCHNMDEPLKKRGTTGNIYENIQNKHIHGNRKQTSCQGLGKKKKWGVTERDSLKQWILWYMYYISIKLLY